MITLKLANYKHEDLIALKVVLETTIHTMKNRFGCGNCESCKFRLPCEDISSVQDYLISILNAPDTKC